MSRDLPKFPNLDHLRKQAKALLRELQKQNSNAKLADAQHAIALGYGFASWPRLKAHVEVLPQPQDAVPAPETGATPGGRGGAIVNPPGPRDPGPVGPGNFARYTESARRAIFFARYWAHRRESRWIESEHLLLGLIEADGSLLDRLLNDPSAMERIRTEIEHRAAGEKSSPAHMLFSAECATILERAASEADALHHIQISLGHFMLGLTGVEGTLARSILVEALGWKGMDKTRSEVIRIVNEEPT